MMNSTSTPSRPDRANLRLVPEAPKPRYGIRRAIAGIALLAAVSGVGVAIKGGIDYVRERVSDRTERVANAAPAAGDICVMVAVGQTTNEVSTIRIADEFADGTSGIQDTSSNLSITMEAHPREGAAICRDPNATELDANHVVAAGNVAAEQVVDTETFDAHGGVSNDVGIG